jgi:hypothetical protein
VRTSFLDPSSSRLQLAPSVPRNRTPWAGAGFPAVAPLPCCRLPASCQSREIGLDRWVLDGRPRLGRDVPFRGIRSGPSIGRWASTWWSRCFKSLPLDRDLRGESVSDLINLWSLNQDPRDTDHVPIHLFVIRSGPSKSDRMDQICAYPFAVEQLHRNP